VKIRVALNGKRACVEVRWRVDPVPTGRYRSFEERGWPGLEVKVQGQWDVLGQIFCDTAYSVRVAKSGEHAALRLRLINHNDETLPRHSIGVKPHKSALPEAKALAIRMVKKHPGILPKGVWE